MRKSSGIGLAVALVLPTLFVAVGAVAQEGSSQDDQLIAYREVRAANVAAIAEGSGNAPTSFAPCVRGVAKGTDFTCDGVTLLAQVPLAMLGTTFGNDIWGWTAPDGEREWALVGGGEGTAFVEVTDPRRPVVTGFLPSEGAGNQFFWRDIKEVDDVAFIGSEDAGSGLQVFDLSRLLDAVPGTTFDSDAVYTGFSSSHNIVAHEDSSTVYAVGANVCSGGLHAVDVSDPLNPVFAGCFETNGYIHDAQCVTYSGPDAEHTGKTICLAATAAFGTAVQELSIVDMTDPMNPVGLSKVEYNVGSRGYSHQGWLTEDQSTWLHGDELDEVFNGLGTSTWVWDVSDLDAPAVINRSFNGETSIDHNLFVDNGYVLAGNYTSGLRVFDASDAANGNIPEVGFFDTYPANDNASFAGGVWGTYPFFAQDHLVAVSTIDGGLFLLQPQVGEK